MIDKALREAAYRLFNDPYGTGAQVMIADNPRPLRHEDPQLGGSGTWIEASIFVPDSEVRR